MLVVSCLFGNAHYTARIDGVAKRSTRPGRQSSQPLSAFSSTYILKPSSLWFFGSVKLTLPHARVGSVGPHHVEGIGFGLAFHTVPQENPYRIVPQEEYR